MEENFAQLGGRIGQLLKELTLSASTLYLLLRNPVEDLMGEISIIPNELGEDIAEAEEILWVIKKIIEELIPLVMSYTSKINDLSSETAATEIVSDMIRKSASLLSEFKFWKNYCSQAEILIQRLKLIQKSKEHPSMGISALESLWQDFEAMVD